MGKKYGTGRKRRGYRKKQFKNKQVKYKPIGNPSGLNALPRVTTLRYVENVSITSPLGIISTYVFRANSLVDPNFSGIGHQPMGFDTWATLYRHYCVIGARIRIVPTLGQTQTTDLDTGVYLSENTSPLYNSSSEFIEADKGDYLTYNISQTTPESMESKYSAKRFFNVNDIKDVQERIGGQVTGNAVQQAYFIMWLQGRSSSESPVVNYRVIIDYIALFSEPQNLPQS